MAKELVNSYEGDLPEGWSIATIGDLISTDGVFIDGDWVESKDQDPSGYVRLIQLADVADGHYKDKSARFLTKEKALELNCTFLKKGDVLIARMPDPLGRACIFPGDSKESVTVVDVCVVRTGTDDVDHKWLMYWVNSPRFRNTISSLQSGTTRKRISRGNLATITFPFPPPIQQKRIVAKIEELFSRIDAGIEALKKAKQLLKQYRQSVLKAAVTGELTKEWREANKDKLEPASQLLERILKKRRQKWEEQQLEQFKAKGKMPNDDKWKEKYKEPLVYSYDGELPEIPHSWTWVSPEQIASTDDYALAIGPFGSNLKVSDYRDEGVPLVFVRNIRAHDYTTTKAKYVSHKKAKELRAHSISGGDVLITKMGEPPGDASIYPHTAPDAVITADCIKWRFSNLIERPELFVHIINSKIIKDQILSRTKGVAQKKISLGTFKSVAFPFTPLEEQAQILRELEKKFYASDHLLKELDVQLLKAEKNKQSILGSAFLGCLNIASI